MRDGGRDSIRRNAAWALAVQATTSVFTAALTLYLVRALGRHGFGVFSLALAIAGVPVLLSDLGLSSAAARFIAERRDDRRAAADVFAQALRLKLLLGALVAVALIAAAGPIADGFGERQLVWPLRGVAIALLGQSVLLLVTGSFVARRRVATNLRIVLGESIAEAGASFALVLLGAGATGAAFGRAIGYCAGAVLGLAVVARGMGRRALAVNRRRPARQLLGYAGAVAAVDWVFTAFEQVDQLLIGALLSTAAVGLFAAPLRLATFLQYPGYAVAAGVAPRLARTPGQAPERAAFVSALRWLMLLYAAISAVLLVWAEPIARLVFGSGYAASANVLRAFVPYVYLSGLAPLVSIGANYLGAARRRVPIAVATLLVNLVIDLVLLRRIGVVAGAIGSGAAFLVYVPGHFRICARELELSMRPFLVTLVRSLIAGAAMAGVLLVTGTSGLSLLDWAIGAAGGSLAFAAMAFATGELSLRELRPGPTAA